MQVKGCLCEHGVFIEELFLVSIKFNDGIDTVLYSANCQTGKQIEPVYLKALLSMMATSFPSREVKK